jgi:hypothetical protein
MLTALHVGRTWLVCCNHTQDDDADCNEEVVLVPADCLVIVINVRCTVLWRATFELLAI